MQENLVTPEESRDGGILKTLGEKEKESTALKFILVIAFSTLGTAEAGRPPANCVDRVRQYGSTTYVVGGTWQPQISTSLYARRGIVLHGLELVTKPDSSGFLMIKMGDGWLVVERCWGLVGLTLCCNLEESIQDR